MSAPIQSDGVDDQRSSPRTRPEAICRTCGNCRRRKVKCDGQQPECKKCQLRGQLCEYPQDARKTANRSKKTNVRALQRQLEDLRGQIQEQITSEQARETEASIHGNRGLNQPIQLDHGHKNLRSAARNARQSSTAIHNDQRGPRLQTAAPHSPVEQRVDGQKLATGPEPARDACEVQVYGVTSLLQDHASHSSLPNPHSQQSDQQNVSECAVQDRLITLYVTPSILKNIDFDGVSANLALHLLDLHWNRLHLLYLLTYRPAIMDSLINNGPYINKLLLNAIYLQSSLYTDCVTGDVHSRPETSGLRFYERFKNLLVGYIDQPNMPIVVALLACGACLLQYGKQSAAWVYSGMAHRMILDLGYHLDGVSPQGEAEFTTSCIETEMRRRVFWGAYANVKFQSLFLGRPPSIHQDDCSIPQQYLDTYEEMEEWRPYVDPQTPVLDCTTPYRGRPSYAISTFHSLLRLSIIAAQIIDSFYSIKSSKRSILDHIQTRGEIRATLAEWKDTLPLHLRFDPNVDDTPPPNQIAPHTTYYTLIILTEQAFLSGTYFDHTSNLTPAEGRIKCIDAAFRICKLIEAYKKAFTLRRVHYGISYATYSAVLVLLQQSAHIQDGEHEKYLECIQFFWTALLEIEAGCSHSLKRPMKLLRTLMRRVKGVAERVDMDGPSTDGNGNGTGNGNDLTMNNNHPTPPLTEMYGISGLDGTAPAHPDNWDSPWYSSIADDTIFGIFTQD
ncbi:fungal-specific transcription factor domain-containing protein [Aspergillus karnatakaensis]|uniref:transcription factor domain-containing protein n=1 Tax=Aspergillus karnatakaensis TaxID=1810916 RepID=UPI003CCCF6C1